MSDPKLLLDGEAIERTTKRMVDQIAARVKSPENLVLVGIRSHGVTLARRMRKVFMLEYEWELPLGILDINLYRDDLDQLEQQPMLRPTEIDFDVTDQIIVLIDDVLCTGRTVRCALDAIMDFGRPRAVLFATMVDRGLRELPIQPDFVGVEIETLPEQVVKVHFDESDGDNGIWIWSEEEKDEG